jgi:hypothetical protein
MHKRSLPRKKAIPSPQPNNVSPQSGLGHLTKIRNLLICVLAFFCR